MHDARVVALLLSTEVLHAIVSHTLDPSQGLAGAQLRLSFALRAPHHPAPRAAAEPPPPLGAAPGADAEVPGP